MHFYNNQQEWTPIEVDGNTIVYSLQSNGTFRLLDAARRLVFEFQNDMQEDFTIAAIYNYNQAAPNTPGPVIIAGDRYWQSNQVSKSGEYTFWVESTGTDITSLEVTGTNNVEVSKQAFISSLGVTYLRIFTKFANCEQGLPVEVRVGNKLIRYVVTVT